jgi:ketosteroid isomerase-like protein
MQLVRGLYEAWERGDFSSADWADPMIEYVIVDGPSPGHWQGLAGLRDAWREQANAWEDFGAEPDEFREIDDDRVLVITSRRGRGKTSGLEIANVGGKSANVFVIRDGRVASIVTYWDRERALADLGLAPEGGLS